jgi:hypothetical protein
VIDTGSILAPDDADGPDVLLGSITPILGATPTIDVSDAPDPALLAFIDSGDALKSDNGWGQIWLAASFRDGNGRTCRRFEQSIVIGSATRHASAIVCKTDTGAWHVTRPTIPRLSMRLWDATRTRVAVPRPFRCRIQRERIVEDAPLPPSEAQTRVAGTSVRKSQSALRVYRSFTASARRLRQRNSRFALDRESPLPLAHRHDRILCAILSWWSL